MTLPTGSLPPTPQTLVFFHAHPDDEASQTSGTMARAVDAGHRVVVVYATNGEHGQAPPDLRPGESVADRRRAEAAASAAALGTARVVWLGYADSGMTGWQQNGAAGAFCNADVDEAAMRLATVLDEEGAAVLTCYDSHGGYGHPDHVQVHRVGHRAAQLAARRPRLLESTMSRDAMRRIWRQALAAAQADASGGALPAEAAGLDPDRPMDDGNPMGTAEADIHWQVDVSAFLPRKRAALKAHASQATDVGLFLSLPPPVFAAAFGSEYFIEPGRAAGMRLGWILDGPGPGTGTNTSPGTGTSTSPGAGTSTSPGTSPAPGASGALGGDLRKDRGMPTPLRAPHGGERP